MYICSLIYAYIWKEKHTYFDIATLKVAECSLDRALEGLLDAVLLEVET